MAGGGTLRGLDAVAGRVAVTVRVGVGVRVGVTVITGQPTTSVEAECPEMTPTPPSSETCRTVTRLVMGEGTTQGASMSNTIVICTGLPTDTTPFRQSTTF